MSCWKSSRTNLIMRILDLFQHISISYLGKPTLFSHFVILKSIAEPLWPKMVCVTERLMDARDIIVLGQEHLAELYQQVIVHIFRLPLQ